MSHPQDPIRAALDPDVFRSEGHRLVDALADYLSRALAGEPMPVLPWREPDQAVEAWPGDLPAEPTGDLAGLLERVIAESTHLHHPHYVGHQVTAPLPLPALTHLACALLNSATAVYEMGPAATAMERSVLRWMACQLGWGTEADGVLTSGGSLGNLTALLAARQHRAGYDVWKEGEAGGPPLALLVGEQAHYSVARAAQVMGIGRHGVVPVPVDERYRMRPEALETARRSAEADGRKVIAVVASSPSTATGAFDPLGPIADYCAEQDLWLHVDGAHGAAAALSERYRHLLDGIDRADSVVWDAHKMMLTPALCTAVLYRDGRRSYEAFAQQASYLLHKQDPREEWYNLCGRNFECTKPMMAVPLYAALAVHGTKLFGDYVTSRFDLGRRFAHILAEAPDFTIPVEPECNIVCFRHTPEGVSDLDALQARIRRRIIESGAFYLVQTQLPTGLHLRTTIINPLTTEADLRALMGAIRAAAAG